MICPVEQQMFLKTSRRRADGLEEESARLWHEWNPWERAGLSLPSRASAWNENKLKGFSGPKQDASWAHCNLDILHYRHNSVPHFILFCFYSIQLRDLLRPLKWPLCQ